MNRRGGICIICHFPHQAVHIHFPSPSGKSLAEAKYLPRTLSVLISFFFHRLQTIPHLKNFSLLHFCVKRTKRQQPALASSPHRRYAKLLIVLFALFRPSLVFCGQYNNNHCEMPAAAAKPYLCAKRASWNGEFLSLSPSNEGNDDARWLQNFCKIFIKFLRECNGNLNIDTAEGAKKKKCVLWLVSLTRTCRSVKWLSLSFLSITVNWI